MSALLNTSTAELGLSTTSAAFGTQPDATLSDPLAVTVTNDGDGLLKVSRVQVVGANRSDFVISTDDCATDLLGRGSTCQIEVRFAPSVDGARSAALRITPIDVR